MSIASFRRRVGKLLDKKLHTCSCGKPATEKFEQGAWLVGCTKCKRFGAGACSSEAKALWKAMNDRAPRALSDFFDIHAQRGGLHEWCICGFEHKLTVYKVRDGCLLSCDNEDKVLRRKCGIEHFFQDAEFGEALESWKKVRKSFYRERRREIKALKSTMSQSDWHRRQSNFYK